MHRIEDEFLTRFPAVRGWRRLSATQRLALRGVGALGMIVLLAGLVGGWSKRILASADAPASVGASGVVGQWRVVRHSLDSVSGELELARLQLERAEAVLAYSTRYRIPADLAALIYDAAVREGLDPELGFRLVRIESGFDPRAVSSVDAIGLVQVRLSTARAYDADITRQGLFDPATNLRIGFRYLRDLIESYGELRLALLAYNRGPGRVGYLLGMGEDPGNGFASRIMEGYAGM